MEPDNRYTNGVAQEHEQSELTAIAYFMKRELDKHFSQKHAAFRQVIALGEESGEFLGAYRRWIGEARRTGTEREAQDELGDVVITAFVTAAVFGWDLDQIVRDKATEIFSRGWKDER